MIFASISETRLFSFAGSRATETITARSLTVGPRDFGAVCKFFPMDDISPGSPRVVRVIASTKRVCMGRKEGNNKREREGRRESDRESEREREGGGWPIKKGGGEGGQVIEVLGKEDVWKVA